MRRAAFKGNIIIWNLPDDFTDEQLAELFDEHGLVLGAKIERWPFEPGRTARGLVDLAPAKAIDQAVEALDGFRVDACKLKVRRVPESAPKPPKPKPVGAARTLRAEPSYSPMASRAPGEPGNAGRTLRTNIVLDEDSVRTPVPPRKPIVEYRSLPSRKLVAR